MAQAAGDSSPLSGMAWQQAVILLFIFCLILGVLAVVGGVGGGVLFVPLVGTFFPFHMDFVRGAGLMVALCVALSASPALLKKNMASLRLALPFALAAAFSSIFGAMAGLALPEYIVRIALGAAILSICLLMTLSKKTDFPDVQKQDTLAKALRLCGIYHEASLKRDIEWKTTRTLPAIALFFIIGFLAGMFGLGAGWANVPVLNLFMGAPLKIAVGTSIFLLSITDTSAAWIYLNNGAVLPVIVFPSIAGVMLGSKIGVQILEKVKPSFVKWVVISILAFSGIMSMLKGLKIF